MVKVRDAATWLVPDRVVNFVCLISKTKFEQKNLDNVIDFNTHCYKITLYLVESAKSSSEFSLSWIRFNIWLTI